MSEPTLLSLLRGAIWMRLQARRRASQVVTGLGCLALAMALLLMAAGVAGYATHAALVASGTSPAMAGALVALGFLVLALVLALLGQRAISRATRL